MFKNIAGFFVNKKQEKEKKSLSAFESLVVIVILGVVIILAGSFLIDSKDNAGTMNETSSLSDTGQPGGLPGQPWEGQEIIADMEERLAGLLSQVEGAGQVKVMIYADSSSEQIPAYNNEQDTRNDQSSNGTSSEISETRELALSGDDTPVILKIIVPQIKGVVVVAEGANDLLIKEQLNTAVCTLLGIPEHRVQILKHK